MNALAYSKVKDNLDLPTVSNLFNKGVLSDENLNESMLELIGSFWFSGNKTIASNITSEFFSDLTDFCFSLRAENETIYTNCKSKGQVISVTSRLASGYEIGKPVFGYVARAWVTKVVKNTTEIIPFYPEGSGWTARRLEVTKKFRLPANVTILNATLYVSVHFGTTQTQAQFEQLKVNGIQKKTDVVWLYLQEESHGTEITTAAYGYVDVTNEIVPGDNEIYLVIGTPNYHSHLHPGMRLVVTYTIPQNISQSPTKFSKKYYFDNVVGRTGAWSTLSFYIPENAKSYSVKLHLSLKDIEDTGYLGKNATDILVFVNNYTVYDDGITSGCYYYTGKGYYCERDLISTKDVLITKNITEYVKKGTNIISVYANCYGDIHWGNDEAVIYSDPLIDPISSSYVEVSYELDSPSIRYGEIDITKEILFGGNATNPKNFLFNVSITPTKRSLETFVHIAQAFSSMTEAYVNNSLVFESPSPRAVPENIYIPSTMIRNGTNLITLKDVQPSGGLSITNYFLPWSSVEHRFIVKGIVGYGKVFGNLTEAINDAIDRLLKQVGEEQISASNLQIDKKSVFGLRWFWGPSNFKVIVWEK